MDYPLARQFAADFQYLAETGSTNRDLLATHNAQQFQVLVSDFQLEGRGRLQRRWEAPAGSSLMASILLKPKFPDPTGLGWLSLLAALAIHEALAEFSVPTGIKWPNDVLVGERKLCGILAELAESQSVVVIGFGINFSQQQHQLPAPGATSLALEGFEISKDELLAKILQRLRHWYQALDSEGGAANRCGLRSAVIAASSSLGREVRVSFPDGTERIGIAKSIDDFGRLVVQDATEFVVSAADIQHLRML